MTINVFSKLAVAFADLSNSALISIRSKGASSVVPTLKSKPVRVLELEFDDVTVQGVPESKRNNFIFFDDKMADQVVDFFNQCLNEGITQLAINCEAGVSRSASMATALRNCLEGQFVFNLDVFCKTQRAFLDNAVFMDNIF
jgi:predicted protein tyrosine phosphatase